MLTADLQHQLLALSKVVSAAGFDTCKSILCGLLGLLRRLAVLASIFRHALEIGAGDWYFANRYE